MEDYKDLEFNMNQKLTIKEWIDIQNDLKSAKTNKDLSVIFNSGRTF